MTLDLDDTICAIASAAGGAARGIVRLSGPRAIECVRQVFAPAEELDFAAIRRPQVILGDVQLATLGAVAALAYLWPTMRSYTRQPAAELHLPGSPPVLEAALAAVCEWGARLARPGEFTLRAFLAGRIDLTQAEAVLGVIDAAGASALGAALAQLAGGLARPLAQLRESLLDLLAHLEAGLDFVDENIEFITAEQLCDQLAAAEQQLAAIERQMSGRGEAGELPRVVLVGLPNAGKSSLLNALAGDAAAIVSPRAGTTRDFVTRRIDLGGRTCLLVDTAGLAAEVPAEAIAANAQSAARQRAAEADLLVLCLDASREASGGASNDLPLPATSPLIVWTKCDLKSPRQPLEGAIATSSRTGLGLNLLREAIAQRLNLAAGEGGAVVSTAARCRESLALARAALARASAAAGANLGQELIAAEVRLALDELGQVVGAVYTEDLLDRVFSRFCIGK